jgi:hypothetical protein
MIHCLDDDGDRLKAAIHLHFDLDCQPTWPVPNFLRPRQRIAREKKPSGHVDMHGTGGVGLRPERGREVHQVAIKMQRGSIRETVGNGLTVGVLIAAANCRQGLAGRLVSATIIYPIAM